jgi:hypothetical protein
VWPCLRRVCEDTGIDLIEGDILKTTLGRAIAIFALLLGSAQLEAAHHRQEVEIIAINTAGFDPSKYSSVVLRVITDDKFLASVGERHNLGDIAKRADWWDDTLAANLKGALRPGDQGWVGKKPLQLTVGMLDMTAGKRGIVRWEFYLWDGRTKVADFTVVAPNGSGFLTDPTGQRHRKLVPPEIVEAINDFLGGLKK